MGTIECFNFLLEIARQNPHSYHVIYGGNYDANKILKDLIQSEYRLRKLWDTEAVFYEHYYIQWIKKKWIEIKDKRTEESIKLYDVIGFFQQSFVKTLDQWSDSLSPSVLKKIKRIENMKAKRGQFKWSERQKILEYCQWELEALVEVMSAFRSNHLAAGLPPIQSIYGPGAIANSLLRQHHITNHMLEPESNVRQASLVAFAAGRIERLRYGNHEGPTTIADINSAYPFAISELPSLCGGWKRYRFRNQNVEPIPMSLYHVRYYNHSLYASPLFYRKGLTKSRPIFFPNPKGEACIDTWIWTPEYEILQSLGLPFQLLEGYIFQGDTNSRPFAWLKDLYEKRREYKRDNNPAEKNLKLAYNSVYGKFVQQAGYKNQKKIPKWFQIEWGGYVTSSTRAQIYNAMLSINFHGVVGVETDSIIIASGRKPKLHYGDGLGEWSLKTFSGITYIQSGVYWLKSGDQWLDKYSKGRGYLPGSLTREEVIDAWNSNPFGDSNVQREGQTLGMVVNARGKEFITLGHCFRPGQTLENWGDWHEGPKKLSLWRTTKRVIARDGNPATRLLDTIDQTDFNGWSSPYSLEWGDEEEL